MKRKFGMSFGKRMLTHDNYVRGKENGLDLIEISLDGDGYAEFDFRGTIADIRSCGIEVWSMHLPFSPQNVWDMANTDKDELARGIAKLGEYVKIVSDLGVAHFVIHASREPYRDDEKELRVKIAADSLSKLADVADRGGAVLCVEDLPRTCVGNGSEEMLRLLAADSRLRTCFDTNHLLYEDPLDFMDKVGKTFVTTHFSDYDGFDEKHWLPGEGVLKWDKIMDKFDELGYDGPILYELGFWAPGTIERRDLTFADFAANHAALCANGIPEAIGRPLVPLKGEKR